MIAPTKMKKPSNWQDFEKLCKLLWGEIWDCEDTIKQHGRQGQNQHGVDVYAYVEKYKGYCGIQCKGKDDYINAELTEGEIDAEIIKERAERYLGCEYNHSFYPDNGKFYCSQYIAEILPIFDIVPMKFGDGEKEVSDYWKKYYEDLGVPIPLDKPGTNPSQIAKSEKLKYIGKLDY